MITPGLLTKAELTAIRERANKSDHGAQADRDAVLAHALALEDELEVRWRCAEEDWAFIAALRASNELLKNNCEMQKQALDELAWRLSKSELGAARYEIVRTHSADVTPEEMDLGADALIAAKWPNGVPGFAYGDACKVHVSAADEPSTTP